MALCKNCPALKEGFAGIERYDFGTGCPDDDHDVYGGDCISMHRSNDNDHCPDCGGILEHSEVGDGEYSSWCKQCEVMF
jgi:hypothetical protein